MVVLYIARLEKKCSGKRGCVVKRVGLNSGGEVARFFFLEKRGNTGIIGKTDAQKHAIPSHFPIIKRSRPALHNSLGSTDLLKGHPAVAHLLSDLLRGHSAVARSTNIYKQKTHAKFRRQTPASTVGTRRELETALHR